MGFQTLTTQAVNPKNKKKIDTSMDVLKAQKEQIKANNDEIKGFNDLSKEVKGLKDDKKKVLADIRKKKKELGSYDSKIEEKNGEIDALIGLIKDEKIRFDIEASKTKEQGVKTAKAKTQFDNLNIELAEILERHETKLLKMRDDEIQLEANKSRIKDESSEANKSLADLNKEIEKKEERLGELKSLEEDVNGIKKDKAKLGKELADLNTKKGQTQKDLDELVEQILEIKKREEDETTKKEADLLERESFLSLKEKQIEDRERKLEKLRQFFVRVAPEKIAKLKI